MAMAGKQSKESLKMGEDRDAKNGGGLDLKKEKKKKGLFPAASEAHRSAE